MNGTRKKTKLKPAGALLGALVMVFVAGCGVSANGGSSGKENSGSSGEEPAYSPHIDPADFTTTIDNEYFPLKPGTTFVYEGKTESNSEHNEVTVTRDTRRIMGVDCVVVDDKVEVDGKLAEHTFDWYAQDSEGNVWYFGEDSKEYENGKVASTGGSWEAGKDGARPGILMQAHPKVGQSYRQEYYKGEAEDMAQALDLNGSASVPYGDFDHVLVTNEWTPLEPGVAEHKFYAPGVGTVLETAVKGPMERLELVDVKHE